MRPRIPAQKVSQAEIIMCDGVSRPRRIKTTSHIYTYVFERKVYLKRNETSIYIECGFKIYYE